MLVASTGACSRAPRAGGAEQQPGRQLPWIEREVVAALDRARPWARFRIARGGPIDRGSRRRIPAARRAAASSAQGGRVERLRPPGRAMPAARSGRRSRGAAMLQAPAGCRPRAATGATLARRAPGRSTAPAASSGVSISNCTSAVVALVDPSIGPRRSISITPRPAAVQALGDHRARNPHADHQHPGARCAPQRLGRHPRRAVGAPDRPPGPQVELPGQAARPLSSGFRMIGLRRPWGHDRKVRTWTIPRVW